MIEYQYKNYSLALIENDILITDNNTGLIKRIPLAEENKSLGKINIPLSNKCNMQCLYCGEAYYMEGEHKKIDIGFAFSAIKAYLRYIKYKAIEITKIQLSFDYGGEPVCELDNLEKIAGFFREECLKEEFTPIVQITTNGVWNSKMLPRIIETVDEVIVSLDGYKELHDKYRICKSGTAVFEQAACNARELYNLKKLKQFSCVITQDSIDNYEKLADFFAAEFPKTTVKMNPVIYTGSAVKNDVKRISVKEWNSFMKKIIERAGDKLKIIDCRPEKSPDKKYLYGCGYMDMTSWFCWIDKRITCCTDRDSEDYVIGIYEDNRLIMNEDLMSRLYSDNNVLNIEKCASCIAKFYCAGGCPKFRYGLIDCDRRKEKYAGILINYIAAKG